MVSWYFELHFPSFEHSHTVVAGIFEHKSTEIAFEDKPTCRFVDSDR